MRFVHPGGEALTTDVADRWARGRRLVNDYGPTETTVTAMRGLIQPGQAISIGQPVPGMRAWVLNEDLEEVSIGEQGELCLGGIGLARGYRNQPELTAEEFPVHPRLRRRPQARRRRGAPCRRITRGIDSSPRRSSRARSSVESVRNTRSGYVSA